MAHPRRFTTNHLFLIVNKNKHYPLKKPLFYLRISKKTVTKAVDRNLLKRRLREIVREYKDKLPVGLVLSIGVAENIVKKPFPELKSELLSLLKQANLI